MIAEEENVEGEEMITSIPRRGTVDDSVFVNLEEEMDTRDLSRKRSHRVPEEDEEEQARTMKYQSESHSDATMSNINKVWICSFSQNQELTMTVEQYLSEIKQLHHFMDDRTGKSLDTEKYSKPERKNLVKSGNIEYTKRFP